MVNLFGRRSNETDTAAKQPAQQADETNTETNLNPFAQPATIRQQDDNQRQQAQTQAQPISDRAAQLREYYRASGLYNGIDYDRFIEAVRNGDTEAASELLNTMLENSVRVSVNAANRLIEAQAAKAVEDAVTRSTTTTRNELAMQTLLEEMPFLSKPEILPVAETVLDGFLAQGKSMRQALDATMKYFEQTIQTGAQFFGFERKSATQRPGARTFADNRSPSRTTSTMNDSAIDDDGAIDWVSILSSGARQFDDAKGSGSSQQ